MWNTCLLCQKSSQPLLCARCERETLLLIHTRHLRDRKIPGTAVPLHSFVSYEGKVRDLIQIAKGTRLEKSQLLDPWLAWAAERMAESVRAAGSIDLVVPIPDRRFAFDGRRRLTHDLAQLIASWLQVPCMTSLLGYQNIWHEFLGKPQKEKNRWQRLLEAPSFATQRHSLRVGSRLLLVDDVCTTGGSLRAAMDSLRRAGLEITAAAALADTPLH